MNVEQQMHPMDFNRDVHCLLGLPFDSTTMTDIVCHVREAAVNRKPCFISTPNLNFLITCLTDNAFRDSVLESNLSIADGMPIVWIAKLLGIPILERVPGSDMFEHLRGIKDDPIKVYFFGGMDGVAKMACDNLNAESAGLVCVGFDSPGFGTIEAMSSDEILDKINASGADFLVVSLGAQKGQAWITRNRPFLKVPVISHLGAVVNFVAGNIQRAPKQVQKIGMEWLWRIYQEPKLWSRYLKDGLCLSQLLVCKILPYAIWIRFKNKSLDDSNPIGLTFIEDNEVGVTIKLSGNCTRKSIIDLKHKINVLALTHNSFYLDLEQVPVIDSAFIGLCLLLYRYTTLQGGKLALLNVNQRNKKIIRWNCAQFLL